MNDKEKLIYRLKQEAYAKTFYSASAIQALEFRREQYGLTEKEFSEILGMRPSHYSEFVNGKISLPKNAIRRAVAIGVPALPLI